MAVRILVLSRLLPDLAPAHLAPCVAAIFPAAAADVAPRETQDQAIFISLRDGDSIADVSMTHRPTKPRLMEPWTVLRWSFLPAIHALFFFALNFAHLARCAAAIFARAAVESLRVPLPATDFPLRPLNTAIALSNSHVLLSTALLPHLDQPLVSAFHLGEDLAACGSIILLTLASLDTGQVWKQLWKWR